jgi:hypothetical protein
MAMACKYVMSLAGCGLALVLDRRSGEGDDDDAYEDWSSQTVPLPSIWSFLLLRHWPGRALSSLSHPLSPLLLSPSIGHQIDGQEQENGLNGATLPRTNLQRCVCGELVIASHE